MYVARIWSARSRNAVITAVAAALLAAVLPGSPLGSTALAADSGCDRSAAVPALEDAGSQVQAAAQLALTGDDAAVCAFLGVGWETARQADARLNVGGLIARGGPSLRSAAETVLASNDPEQIDAFLRTGWQTPTDIDLRVRVNQMMAIGGPRLKVAAQAALDDGSPEKLESFLSKDWSIPAGMDRRVQVNQILAAGGPEVKRIAQRALDADDAGDSQALDRFIGSEWEVASARDREAATVGDLAGAAVAAGKVAAERTQTAVDQAGKAVDAAAAAAASAKAAEELAKSAGGNAKVAAAAAAQATSAARQAASAAKQAVAAAQAARASARAAADAAARAATAAAKAGQQAAAANKSAALAAGDASKAADARKGAEAARKAEAAAQQLKTASDYARNAADLANAAATYANSAGSHSDDAGRSAQHAGDLAQAAGADAGAAHSAASDCRVQANRATAAALDAAAMAAVARMAADTAQAAADAAASDAHAAAAAADDAAAHAGDAATAATRSTKAANAATAAAQRAVKAMKAAQKVYDDARAADADRLEATLAQGQEGAAASTQLAEQVQAGAAWDAAEAAKRTAGTNRLMAEAVAPGTDRSLAVRDARTVAVTLTRSSGSWTQEAARQALGGDDDAVLEFVRTGAAFAAAQDDRSTITALTLGDDNPKLAAAAASALAGSDGDVAAFLRTQDYPGRETEERLTVNQILARARTDGNPVTQQRAQNALDSTDPAALRDFIETGQFAATEVDERVKVNQILADPESGPELKVMAQVALDAPAAAVHNFLTAGRYTAAEHDYDSDRHTSMVSALLAQGYQASSLATQNAALAQQAAALARKAQADADQAKKDAAAAARQAADYATQAQGSADKADAAADRAEASADTAARAARSANASADQAAASARRADVSASIASVDARDAYAAYKRAYASATAAGKDATAAKAEAQAAIDDVNARIQKARGALARSIYEHQDECLDLRGFIDTDACMDRLYAAHIHPARTAYINSDLCRTLFDTRGAQYQNCLNDVLSPNFGLEQLIDAFDPYILEAGVMLAGAAAVTGVALLVFFAPEIISLCTVGCGFALELSTPFLAPELIGVDLAVSGGVAGSVGTGGVFTYTVVRLRGLLEKVGVQSLAGASDASRLASWFGKCATQRSFPAATRVLMADGHSTEPIADVRVGDRVLSTNPYTGTTEPEPVTALHVRSGMKELVDVRVDGPRGMAGGTVTATANHPFWVKATREWRTAGELRSGDGLRTGPGSWAQIGSVTHRTERATVHNLTVAGHSTFYVIAGNTPLLVHNDPTCPPTLVLGLEDYSNDLAKTLGGITYNGKLYSQQLGMSGGKPFAEWMGKVGAHLAANGKVAVSLRGLKPEGGTPLAKIQNSFNNGVNGTWGATDWEIWRIGYYMRIGSLDYESVTWYVWNDATKKHEVVKIPKDALMKIFNPSA